MTDGRLSLPPLPASGAWRPGDPVGRRRLFTLPQDRPFILEGGGSLDEIVVAYETWGSLDDDASNAILLCHAWTGDSHVTGPVMPGHDAPGWWEGMVGPGLPIDTERFFVVCPNTLGGCQGSTGPSSIEPSTGRPYGSRFPVVTIRDADSNATLGLSTTQLIGASFRIPNTPVNYLVEVTDSGSSASEAFTICLATESGSIPCPGTSVGLTAPQPTIVSELPSPTPLPPSPTLVFNGPTPTFSPIQIDPNGSCQVALHCFYDFRPDTSGLPFKFIKPFIQRYK